MVLHNIHVVQHSCELNTARGVYVNVEYIQCIQVYVKKMTIHLPDMGQSTQIGIGTSIFSIHNLMYKKNRKYVAVERKNQFAGNY